MLNIYGHSTLEGGDWINHGPQVTCVNLIVEIKTMTQNYLLNNIFVPLRQQFTLYITYTFETDRGGASNSGAQPSFNRVN